MDVSLTPELERLVREEVASSRYSSTSEVVHDALRLLQERQELRRLRVEELRREIAVGLEADGLGDLHDGEAVMAELLRHHQAMVKDREEAAAGRS